MSEYRYDPVGHCIYCGETDLRPHVRRFTDEHIVPLSFGGHWVLPQASCKLCEQTINREIETPVSHQEWGKLRAKRDFPSRRKKRRDPNARVELTRSNGTVMRVPIADYSHPVPLYLFEPARILTGAPNIGNDMGWRASLLTDEEAELALKDKYSEWNGAHRVRYQPYPWARLIAKIGYAYAVAEAGPGAFTPLVTDIIRGLSDDYFLTVGGSGESQPAVPDSGDHVLGLAFQFFNPTKAHVIASVRLFSQINAPDYHVVAGLVDLAIPAHAAAFSAHQDKGRLTFSVERSEFNSSQTR